MLACRQVCWCGDKLQIYWHADISYIYLYHRLTCHLDAYSSTICLGEWSCQNLEADDAILGNLYCHTGPTLYVREDCKNNRSRYKILVREWTCCIVHLPLSINLIKWWTGVLVNMWRHDQKKTPNTFCLYKITDIKWQNKEINSMMLQHTLHDNTQ